MLQKDISEALEQMTNYSERYKWRSMSSRIIMQLCEDSLRVSDLGILFKNKAKQNKKNDAPSKTHIMWWIKI